MTNIDFDFDRSVMMAWERFSARLAEVLSMMDDTEPLTLLPYGSAESGAWYVRFRMDARDHVTAAVPETIDGVDPDTARWLSAHAWTRATRVWEKQSDQQDCSVLADDCVDVLRQIFQVEHPVFLDSDVLAEILAEPSVPDEAPLVDLTVLMPDNDIQLLGAVSAELEQAFGATPMRDEDGDFAVRIGSTMMFVRVSSDAKEVRLFSLVVHDVAGRSRAMEVLNDVNAHARWVKFYLTRDKVMATLSVSGRPFVPAQFRMAVREMTKVADGVDGPLAMSLEGRTTFDS